MLLRGRGLGLGDGFEYDNYDDVQAALAATPPAMIVPTPPSWLATPFAIAQAPAAAAAATALWRGAPVAAPPAGSKGAGSWFTGASTPAAALQAQNLPPAMVPTTVGSAVQWPAAPVASSASSDPAAAASRVLWTKIAIAGALGVGVVLLLRR